MYREQIPREQSDLYRSHAVQVEAAEHKLLAEHEPLIDFRVVEDPGLSEGRQSRVSVLEYDRGREAVRVIWKRMGAGKALTEPEAQAMHERLRPYKASLEATGWRVPRLLYTRTTAMPAEFQIFSYEQYVGGGDGEKLVSNPGEPNFRKWFLVDEMLRILYQYPESSLRRDDVAGQTITRLPHGLDLKLANLVLEAGSNQLYFVDLFGPKELDDNGDWLIYSTKLDSLPRQSLTAVCATREGAILRCWRLAEQSWPGAGREPGDLRAEFLEHLERLGPPQPELRLIEEELDGNYPWLDRIYDEYRV